MIPQVQNETLSQLLGFFGGNHRTPEEKVSDLGGFFSRTPYSATDPNSAPPRIPIMKQQQPSQEDLPLPAVPQAAAPLAPIQQDVYLRPPAGSESTIQEMPQGGSSNYGQLVSPPVLPQPPLPIDLLSLLSLFGLQQ